MADTKRPKTLTIQINPSFPGAVNLPPNGQFECELFVGGDCIEVAYDDGAELVGQGVARVITEDELAELGGLAEGRPVRQGITHSDLPETAKPLVAGPGAESDSDDVVGYSLEEAQRILDEAERVATEKGDKIVEDAEKNAEAAAAKIVADAEKAAAKIKADAEKAAKK